MELRHHTQLGTARRPGRRAPVAPGQAGIGLVESIVALALVSTVILALASGLLSLLSTSRVNAETQKLQAAVTAWTEALKVLPYQDCATGYSLSPLPVGWAAPTTGTAVVTAVEHWQPDQAGFGAFAAADPGCTTDAGAQRLTVDVTVDGTTAEALVVLRRPPPGAGP